MALVRDSPALVVLSESAMADALLSVTVIWSVEASLMAASTPETGTPLLQFAALLKLPPVLAVQLVEPLACVATGATGEVGMAIGEKAAWAFA